MWNAVDAMKTFMRVEKTLSRREASNTNRAWRASPPGVHFADMMLLYGGSKLTPNALTSIFTGPSASAAVTKQKMSAPVPVHSSLEYSLAGRGGKARVKEAE